MKSKVLFTLFIVTALLIATFSSAFAQDDPQSLPLDEPVTEPSDLEVVSPYLSLRHLTTFDGKELIGSLINGPSKPPAGFEREGLVAEPMSGTLASFPSYSWVFGCSAVSGSMIASYYDRNGYPNLYTGPTAGGIMPLTDTSWPTWSDGFDTYPNNPLIASHNGVDGRDTKGSIDDYWYEYGSSNDPYYTGSWSQHSWGTAIGDYMKTSHYQTYGSTDGSTWFYNYGSNEKLTCADMVGSDIDHLDGTYGRKLFYEARGYTVTDCYNQETDNKYAGGFSLANFQASIDAGHPVFINLAGHSIVGYGYSGSTIYIRNTWDNDPGYTYSMTWGESYGGMEMQSVSIVRLAGGGTVTVPTPKAPYGTITDTTPTYKWSKITDATKYQFRAYKGTSSTPTYTKDISSSACGTTVCTNTPSTALSLASYKWQARAYVGGAWKAWSALKSFTVAKPAEGWESNFSSNANGWTKLNGTWTVSGGYYQTPGLSDKFVSAKHDGTYGIFTYTAKMKRTGCSSCSQGIFFNGSPSPLNSVAQWNNGYMFVVVNEGYFSIWQLSGGSESAILSWTEHSAVSSGVNTLKVTYNKNTNYVQFYINNSRVAYGTLNTFPSGQVGVTMYQDATSKLSVDSASLTMSAPSSSLASDGMLISDEETVPVTSGASFMYK